MSEKSPKNPSEAVAEAAEEVTPAVDAAPEAEGAEGEKAKPAYKKSKKSSKQIQRGQAYIQCTYNNTKLVITDLAGGVLGWSSSGLLGFKGAKKSTPYASTQVANDVSEKVTKYGIRDLEVYVKGVGSGREASIRALAARGYSLVVIKDLTPVPHNGCRPRKPRRV